jgi:DNA-binding response OmpR family regulator
MIKTKIVLVEDDEVLSKVLYEELLEAGFDIERAFNGEDGLALIRSKKPNLVLLDLIMPKKGGFDVIADLKKSPATSGIPVIILTMLGRDDEIKKGLQLGANDYIVKSQHAVAEIVEKVKEFFGEEKHPEAAKPKAKPTNEQKSV